jgi:hypothetical protein
MKTSGVAAGRGGRRGRDLLSPTDATGSRTAYVRSGPEFATAVADPSVGTVRLAQPSISVTVTDWASGAGSQPLPLVLTRNVTVEGDPALGAWPIIDFENAKGVVRAWCRR